MAKTGGREKRPLAMQASMQASSLFGSHVGSILGASRKRIGAGAS